MIGMFSRSLRDCSRQTGILLVGLAAMLVPPVLARDGLQPEAASGFAARPAAFGRDAMVVTANPHATEVALAVLRQGGLAVDAAIAAILVLNVVEPQSSGIGGGGFLLHFDAHTGEVSALDGRETAPMAAHEQLFLEPDGQRTGFFDAVVGGRSVGTPGLLRLIEAAHARHGSLEWARLFQPAIELAEQGFSISPRLNLLLSEDRFLAKDEAARRLYYDADGHARAVGERVTNPALAEVLRKVAQHGVDAFHLGDVAHDIVDAVAAEPNPGLLGMEDMAAYRAIPREPLCGSYRSYRVCGMPPPSSGGGSVLSMLGILERFPMPAIEPDSALAAHLFSEAGRLAYADRDTWYGDPRDMQVTPENLIEAEYLRARSGLLNRTKSVGVAEPGVPPGAPKPEDVPAVIERPATTHLSIVDREGNAVALTASIENAFGSRRMVRGFLLNNQLTDFAFDPKGRAGVHPNRVGPGKRPRSSMSPTLVFDPDGKLFAVTGSPGGGQIINYVAASIVALVDWRMAPDRLLARSHVGSRNGPTEVEDTPEGRAVATLLADFGHEPVLRDMTSGLAVIVRDGDGWSGAADPRREGVATGF